MEGGVNQEGRLISDIPYLCSCATGTAGWHCIATNQYPDDYRDDDSDDQHHYLQHETVDREGVQYYM